jgi:hypothetical protein
VAQINILGDPIREAERRHGIVAEEAADRVSLEKCFQS